MENSPNVLNMSNNVKTEVLLKERVIATWIHKDFKGSKTLFARPLPPLASPLRLSFAPGLLHC